MTPAVETAFLDRDAAYRSLVDNSMDAVLLTAPDGRIVYANRASTALLGYTERELRDLGRAALVDASDPRLDAALRERSRTGRFHGELTLKCKDGTRLEVELSSAVFRDETGAEWTSMVIRDITSRKAQDAERIRAAEAIRASERLLNGIFELLPVGVWIADRTGRIVRGNPAGIRIWAGARYVGTSAFGEYKGWWADTGKPIAADEWALARALNKGETSIGEVIRIQCFDGTSKTIINSALPLYDDQGEFVGAIVVNEDITHLKETEAALRHAVESRERVLEIVAHDLRHPLQVILTLVQTLQLEKGRPGDERDALQRMAAQVRRMDRLIQDLLDVAQLESSPLLLERAPMRPEVLVDDITEGYRQVAAASSIDLRRDVRAGLSEVNVDLPKIHRVFDNLIGNAVKFTPPGGSITVGAAADDGDVRFWVADTGRGISAESLSDIFTHRWQGDPERRGLGLGLAIAKSIVEAHGGRIWAESTVGQGTFVFFTIPSVSR